jgi:hypothetical protein
VPICKKSGKSVVIIGHIYIPFKLHKIVNFIECFSSHPTPHANEITGERNCGFEQNRLTVDEMI